MAIGKAYNLNELIKEGLVRKACFETSDTIIYAIFCDLRILESSIPENLNLYDIRHSYYDDMIPSTIENFVFAKYYGNIITKEDLGLKNKDHYIEIKDFDLGDTIFDITEFTNK